MISKQHLAKISPKGWLAELIQAFRFAARSKSAGMRAPKWTKWKVLRFYYNFRKQRALQKMRRIAWKYAPLRPGDHFLHLGQEHFRECKHAAFDLRKNDFTYKGIEMRGITVLSVAEAKKRERIQSKLKGTK